MTVRLEMEPRNLGEVSQSTVIAELRGREQPEEIVLLGGHLDSWDVGTGAHDDAAGCAITLGAARLLHELELRPRRTLRVVLFAAEEFGGHAGDGYLEAHRDELEAHVAALESDSGAFTPDGFSVKATPEVLERVAQLAKPLAAIGADVWIRVPFIPGVNDDRANLDALAEFLGGLEADYPVFLLPYHLIAQDKYGRLGHVYRLSGLEPPPEEQVETAAARLRDAGLRVNIGG